MGIVHPVVAKNIDKKASIVYAEIDLTEFAETKNMSIKYEEPSKYPEMEIDLSFVSDKFSPIADAIAEQSCPLIKKVRVADIYEDENGKSITVRMVFSCPDRTLTREEVMAVADSIIASLKNNGIELKK